ncbi:MAG: hypothetical protein ACQESH_05440, partial [Campylobacterota bacterium]
MNRFKSDFSSRFRILKGGKISLVVSALLVSSSLVVSDANAADHEITDANLSIATTGSSQTIETTEAITNADAG